MEVQVVTEEWALQDRQGQRKRGIQRHQRLKWRSGRHRADRGQRKRGTNGTNGSNGSTGPTGGNLLPYFGTNAYNFNQLCSCQSSLWSGFTPIDQIAWTKSNGNYTNNYATITNAWGVVENTVQQITFSGVYYDMFFNINPCPSGLTLMVKFWVKLAVSGATNFCIASTTEAVGQGLKA